METVLAVTMAADDITPLTEALHARGARLVRLDTEAFPSDVQLDAEPTPNGYRGTLVTRGEHVDLGSLRAIWMGRLATGQKLGRDLEPRVRRACIREASTTLEGVLAGLRAPMVNDLDHALRSERKPLQLVLAAQHGLHVPSTRLGNLPGPLESFARDTPCITKMVSLSPLPVGDAVRIGVPTSRVPDDLDGLGESLRLAPTLFQEHVAKDLDIRAIVIGEHVMAAGVDAQQAEGAEVDWRVGSADLMERFRPLEVPADVRKGLVGLHRALGLDYGAVDFVRDRDGRWVFLETNAGGRWTWLQAIGLDVAGRLADALLTAPFRWGAP